MNRRERVKLGPAFGVERPGSSQGQEVSISAFFTSLAPVSPVLRAFVRALVPEASAQSAEGWYAFEKLIESVLRDRPPALRRQLRIALHLLEWLPVFRYGRPFTSLGPDQRRDFLAFIEDNPIKAVRVGFWGLRTLAFLGYYGQPGVAKAIGYAPDARGWEALG